MFNSSQLSRIEAFISAPLLFLILFVMLWWLPQTAFLELYKELYQPYLSNGPVILHIRSGILVLLLIPGLVLFLSIIIFSFIKTGLQIDVSCYQNLIDRYVRLWGYVVILGLVLTFPINFFVAERIEAKGYLPCKKYNEFGVARRVTGYVIDSMLCVPKKKQAAALKRYEQMKA